MIQRSRRPPKLVSSVRASLDPALHSDIDTGLKGLKACARSLEPVLSTLSDELQILQQIYYKGSNQHRTALFWRRVVEIKRYAERVRELDLLSMVDCLRYSFFSPELQQNSKLLKGPWTHYPDVASVSFYAERFRSCILLAEKMHESLIHAYQSFVLAMQNGAFIHLIITLAGIASRMSTLAQELVEVLRSISDVVNPIISTLDPATVRPVADQSNTPVDVDRVSVPRQNQDIHETGKITGSITRTTIPRAISSKQPEKSKVKKRKRDEIDDIFG